MQKFGAALLSFGLSGKAFHAPFIDVHPGFELRGVWERTTKTLHQHYPNSKSYSSLENLLKDDTVDLVVVNSPTYTHYTYAKQALEAGKNVIIEKAFTATVAEALELKALAEERNAMLSVFQNRRWDSDFKTVCKIIKEGVLGELVEASFSFDRYKSELSPKIHKESPQPGAGIVHDLAPHLIDQALVLFGIPEAVFAIIEITRPTSQVADYIDMNLFYPSLNVRVKSGYFVREPLPSYVLHGKKGSFLKTRGDVQETSLVEGLKPGQPNWGIEPEQDEGLLHTEVDGKVIRERVKTLPGNYMNYYDGIHIALVDNVPPPVTAQDGLSVMRIIEAAYKSSSEKRVIDLS